MTGSRAEKSVKCHKTWFRLLTQRKPNTRLEICKAFQDRLTFLFQIKTIPANLNYHMSIKKSQAKFTENIGLPVI